MPGIAAEALVVAFAGYGGRGCAQAAGEDGADQIQRLLHRCAAIVQADLGVKNASRQLMAHPPQRNQGDLAATPGPIPVRQRHGAPAARKDHRSDPLHRIKLTHQVKQVVDLQKGITARKHPRQRNHFHRRRQQTTQVRQGAEGNLATTAEAHQGHRRAAGQGVAVGQQAVGNHLGGAAVVDRSVARVG